jgi:diguanylate cyclase (GGDEF)-like protein
MQAVALGLDDALAGRNQRYAALTVCVTLFVAASLAAIFGRGPGPEIKPLVYVCGTIWSFADLLTAFLFLAQFYVGGRIMFGVLAVAYALSGLLTWFYLWSFHDLFFASSGIGFAQVPAVVWCTWHVTFPVLVMCGVALDSPLKRVVSRSAIAGWTAAIGVAPILMAILTSAAILAFRDSFPHLIIDTQFQPIYQTGILPFIIILNAGACWFLAARRRPLTPLVLWLGVALFSAAIDVMMVDLSSATFALAFDTGKLMTVFTGCVVLFMILCDIVGLYGRLARVARTDPLTSLDNRRAFDEHFQVVYHNARRFRRSMGLLVIDIDFFKRYNDSYGHLAGDVCLRRVAQAMAECAPRQLDLVARYGGEEFAVILPDTPMAGVLVVAERIRTAVEALKIVHGATARGYVTVSIGVGFAVDSLFVDEGELFESADRALYEAKDHGGNAIVRGTLKTAPIQAA